MLITTIIIIIISSSSSNDNMCLTIIIIIDITDSLRGSPVKIGTIQRRVAWPLRKDDTHKSRSVNNCIVVIDVIGYINIVMNVTLLLLQLY